MTFTISYLLHFIEEFHSPNSEQMRTIPYIKKVHFTLTYR